MCMYPNSLISIAFSPNHVSSLTLPAEIINILHFCMNNPFAFMYSFKTYAYSQIMYCVVLCGALLVMDPCRVYRSAYFVHYYVCGMRSFLWLQLQIIFIAVGYYIFWIYYGVYFWKILIVLFFITHQHSILCTLKDRCSFIFLYMWIINCARSLLKNLFPSHRVKVSI